MAVVLLAVAGVMIRSFLYVYTADLGFKPSNVLTLLLNLPASSYATPQARTAFFDRLDTRLASIPGVESVSIASGVSSRPRRWAASCRRGAPCASIPSSPCGASNRDRSIRSARYFAAGAPGVAGASPGSLPGDSVSRRAR